MVVIELLHEYATLSSHTIAQISHTVLGTLFQLHTNTTVGVYEIIQG